MSTDDRAGDRAGAAPSERRQRATLRELLDELIAFTREVTQRSREMSDKELEHAHQRLEWLADEVWREAVKPGDVGRGKSVEG